MQRVEDSSNDQGANGSNAVIEALLLLDRRINGLGELVEQMHELLLNQRAEKEWYTTNELAEAMGVSQYTVQERWCNQGRIESEKDPESGKWRIPGAEYRRLIAGGGLHSRHRFNGAR